MPDLQKTHWGRLPVVDDQRLLTKTQKGVLTVQGEHCVMEVVVGSGSQHENLKAVILSNDGKVTLELYRAPNSMLYRMDGKQPLPTPLQGLFSSPDKALEAVDAFLATKSKAA